MGRRTLGATLVADRRRLFACGFFGRFASRRTCPECAHLRTTTFFEFAFSGLFSRDSAGIRIATDKGMERLASAAGGEMPIKVDWLHWLFVREGRTMSCGLEARDGLYTLSLVPLWKGDGAWTESFDNIEDAVRRHAQVTRYLQASGWLMTDGVAVKPAA